MKSMTGTGTKHGSLDVFPLVNLVFQHADFSICNTIKLNQSSWININFKTLL